jgi:hypothetical protein
VQPELKKIWALPHFGGFVFLFAAILLLFGGERLQHG